MLALSGSGMLKFLLASLDRGSLGLFFCGFQLANGHNGQLGHSLGSAVEGTELENFLNASTHLFYYLYQ